MLQLLHRFKHPEGTIVIFPGDRVYLTSAYFFPKGRRVRRDRYGGAPETMQEGELQVVLAEDGEYEFFCCDPDAPHTWRQLLRRDAEDAIYDLMITHLMICVEGK